VLLQLLLAADGQWEAIASFMGIGRYLNPIRLAEASDRRVNGARSLLQLF